MIEIEKKFILTDEQEKALINGAEFLGEKKNTDSYYDDANFSLTKKDLWLRERNGRFELKVPMNESIETRVSDQYRELESDKEILEYFNADINQMVPDFLAKKELLPFCTLITTRKKYKKEGFNIDLDSIDFGYTLAEIEYMITDESKINEATSAIVEFAKRHGVVSNNFIYGKVVEYLRRNNPKHFQALIDAWVIK